MQTPSPLTVGRVSGRLFLSPSSPSPSFPSSVSPVAAVIADIMLPFQTRLAGDSRSGSASERCDATAGGSGDRFIQKMGDERESERLRWRHQRGGRETPFSPRRLPPSPRSIPSFLPSLHAFLGRSTRTPLGLTIRGGEGEDGTGATHPLTHSVGRSPSEQRRRARTTHMLFTISQ